MNGPRRRTGLLALAALAACASFACSTILGRYPPAQVDRGSYPECGVATGSLVADAVIATLAGALIAAALAEEGSDDDGGAIIIGAVGVLTFGASAVNGINLGRTCNRARREALLHLDPRPLMVPPPPPRDAGPPATEAGPGS